MKGTTSSNLSQRRDYRDLALADAAFDYVVMAERIASLEADIAIYRELVQDAIAAVRDMTQQRDRLREQHDRVIDDYRRLRAYLLREAA